MATTDDALARTPFFRCTVGYRRVVVEKRDGSRLVVGPRTVRTPAGCRRWPGGTDLTVTRTGFDEVVVAGAGTPAEVVVRPAEVVLAVGGRPVHREDW